MVAKERVVAYATDNPTICRVRQLPREEQEVDMQGSDELCTALDSAFRESSATSESDDRELSIDPALVVREQRARAAKLYNNVVIWSLWYAHSTSMPEEGWIVDIEKKAKRLGAPGVEDKSEVVQQTSPEN
ncbi:hypothetical protein PI124_g21512 [Phytophthora idaei]|nr:hypothetical protein PI124_g21512 [Phytophthora idaei]